MKHIIPLLLIVGLPVVVLSAVGPVAAQSLLPDREASCDPAAASSIPLNDASSEAAACARRTYQLPAADTVELSQHHYDRVEVVAWDEPDIEVETVVVARRTTMDGARSDLPLIKLQQIDGMLTSAGPDDDAPGWWSVKYRLRVPAQTTLAITSDNGDIAVRDVAGGHELQSKNGDIRYRLPAGAGARLQAETNHGAIDVGFPITVQGRLSNQLDTVVGGGGPTVRLVTENGDITIRRAE